MDDERKKELDNQIEVSRPGGTIKYNTEQELNYVQSEIMKKMNNTKAKRFDEGKLQWDLLPWKGLIEVVKVAEMGAKKYGKYNYRKGMEWTRVLNSAFRHLIAIRNGEDRDKESGVLHAAHFVFNGLMLIEYFDTHKELDDRSKEIPGDSKGFQERFKVETYDEHQVD